MMWIKEEDFKAEVDFAKQFLSRTLFNNEYTVPDSITEDFAEKIIEFLFTKTV